MIVEITFRYLIIEQLKFNTKKLLNKTILQKTTLQLILDKI